MVLECALRWTTTSSPRCASASPTARLPCEAPLTRNHARLAPQASAASRWARSNGVGCSAEVDSVCQRRDVEAEGLLADRAQQPLIGALAALVPGHVQARGTPLGVLDERVEVGRLPLSAVHVLGFPRAGTIPFVGIALAAGGSP